MGLYGKFDLVGNVSLVHYIKIIVVWVVHERKEDGTKSVTKDGFLGKWEYR